MSDRSWGGFHLGSRARTPTQGPHLQSQERPRTAGEPITTKGDVGLGSMSRPATSLQSAGSFLSLAPKPIVPSIANTHSHFGTEDESRLREADRVSRSPSTELMVEKLQVHMMNKAPRDPIAPEYNADILHLLEHYYVAGIEFSRTKEQLKSATEEKEKDRAEFASIAKEWFSREDQYKEDIKRLEHMIARKMEDGLANVALARSNSIIRRGGRSDKAGKKIRERIRMLLEKSDENASQPESEKSGGTVMPVRYRAALGDKRLREQGLPRASTVNNHPFEAISDAPRETEECSGASPTAVLTACLEHYEPRITPNAPIVDQDFLVSERIRHGLPVMPLRTDVNMYSSRMGARPVAQAQRGRKQEEKPKESNSTSTARLGAEPPIIVRLSTASTSTSKPSSTPSSSYSAEDEQIFSDDTILEGPTLCAGRQSDRAGEDAGGGAKDRGGHRTSEWNDGARLREPVDSEDEVAVMEDDSELCNDAMEASNSKSPALVGNQGSGKIHRENEQKSVRGFSFALGDERSFSTGGKEMSFRERFGRGMLQEEGTTGGTLGAQETEDIESSNGSASSFVKVMRLGETGSVRRIPQKDTAASSTVAVSTRDLSASAPIIAESDRHEDAKDAVHPLLPVEDIGRSVFFANTFKDKAKEKKNKTRRG
ncbi:hypothetical protein MKZ38_001989 [Zalerion maritima]|uniref:Uncharacterized protein n=1 Tax=Zalerion maritima TaxID=339359 RepID=A0AAD5RPH8_9PEZI|nr:hypothetical protein MKZ38_001989 [Zalerion maritima]